MVKNNNNIWVVVVVSLIVAVIASVATLSLTGNVINVQKDSGTSYCASACKNSCGGLTNSSCYTTCQGYCRAYATANVYTKTEVDKLISNNVSNTIDSRFDKCMTWTLTYPNRDTAFGNMTCSKICKDSSLPGTNSNANQKCLWAGLYGEEKNQFNGTTQDLRIIDQGICDEFPLSSYFDGGYHSVSCFCC